MFTNEFVKDFKILDFTLIRLLHLEPTIMRIINPQSNGVAIQKGNTYTYKTKDYSLYSVQKYHPGMFGDQHHVAGMNVNNSFSIFHSHPALEKDVKKQSPNYWVGYGHLPHVAQDRNVSLAIYNIPEKKGLMQDALLDYTHAYFPSEKFDSLQMEDNYAMGSQGETYFAFVAYKPLTFRDDAKDDIIQNGKQTFWITEAGSENKDGSFDKFCKRIKANKYSFNEEKLVLTYQSNNTKYELEFDGDFVLNGEVINTEYSRYDSPYAKAEKKDKTITYNFNGKSLYLDFENMVREFED
jgi:hypothetical protein